MAAARSRKPKVSAGNAHGRLIDRLLPHRGRARLFGRTKARHFLAELDHRRGLEQRGFDRYGNRLSDGYTYRRLRRYTQPGRAGGWLIGQYRGGRLVSRFQQPDDMYRNWTLAKAHVGRDKAGRFAARG